MAVNHKNQADRYICIHGHFYQPPRENPWLEAIESQDSAYPYHDWNERVTAECYAPNSLSRILDGSNRIVKLVNNYAKMSFNFGPTLLSWLQEKAPEVYRAVLDADRESQKSFSGHGSAMAQPYNHMILPLANPRDKRTQILWGMRDFEHRFGRRPEGMWLPETAVDLESLELMAEAGIRFTVLAPHQASRFRRIGARAWRDVDGAAIDPTMAYEQPLAWGRRMAIFFYDGPISRAVAFERLLASGEEFAHRLLGAFREEREWYEMVHIATDGESYGHHHRFGDMALAYALNYIESNGLARLTNYGEYLERHPPSCQAEIIEKSSWSCAHGVERWRSDCGCNSGAHPGWHQAWRAPLREALDWLRDTLAPLYEEKGRSFFRDPWAARDDYIDLILDRSRENAERFFDRHAARELAGPDKITALKLLELQRHAMLMYTSCGWFFDDLSGLETVQIIHYAGRAIQLAQQALQAAVEDEFVERLSRAASNLPAQGDGRKIYENLVKPAAVDWERLGAHYAVSSMFEAYPERAKTYCYLADLEDSRAFETGKAKLLMGRVKLTSEITWESAVLSFGVLHFGDHNLNGGVREFLGEEAYRELVRETSEFFTKADFPQVIRLMDRHFGEFNYSIRSLFRDEQRMALNTILESTLAETEALYRQIYENYAPMMRFLADLRIPPPRAFQAAAEFVLNAQLRRALEAEELDVERIEALLEMAQRENVALDTATLEFAFRRTLERLSERFLAQPADLTLLQGLEAAVGLIGKMPFPCDLWKIQNNYYRVLETVYPEAQEKARGGEGKAQVWTSHFRTAGEKLMIVVE